MGRHPGAPPTHLEGSRHGCDMDLNQEDTCCLDVRTLTFLPTNWRPIKPLNVINF